MKNQAINYKFKDLLAKFKGRRIDLADEKQHLIAAELIRNYPGRMIYVCDAYVKGIENGFLERNVLRLSNIIGIDHHAPSKIFAKKISSVNLAVDWVNERGVASGNSIVVITHTDYDSIISSLIIRGIIPPKKIFADLAIIADHTGEENEMVDLLQSMSSAHDLGFSLRNLERWSQDLPLEPRSQEMLSDLKEERRRAVESVRNGSFRKIGMVYYAELSRKIESAYFPALMPEAAVILTFSPHRKNKGFWEAKIRLGNAAPESIYLNELGINEFDPFWGGRWNAGSNRRGQGTKIPIGDYAKFLNKKLEKQAKKSE